MPQFSLSGRIQQTISQIQPSKNLEIVGSVFMTFGLEPVSFEEAIFPSLYGLEETTSRPARMQLLRSKLTERGLPVVFYDIVSASTMENNNERYIYLPVRIHHGFQHAKHACILLAPRGEKEATHLLFLTTSANLTKSGWFHNIEFADIEVIEKDTSHSLTVGLQRLMKQMMYWVQQTNMDGTSFRSLTKLVQFIDGLSTKDGYPVLWTGKESLFDFFQQHMQNKEVEHMVLGAPYVSENAVPVTTLHENLTPQKTQIFLPQKDGQYAVSNSWFHKVQQLSNTSLHNIRKMDTRDKDRNVHAKFYMFKTKGTHLVGIGSPNLSEEGMAAFSNSTYRSHYETLILRESKEWWEVLDPQCVDTIPDHLEHLDDDESPDDLKYRFCNYQIVLDWETKKATFFVLRSGSRPHTNIKIYHSSNPQIYIAVPPLTDTTFHCFEPNATEQLFEWFEHSHHLNITYDGLKKECFILLLETNVLHAPPKTEISLQASDYLSYWNLHFVHASQKIHNSIERIFDKRDQHRNQKNTLIGQEQEQRAFMGHSVTILNSFAALQSRCNQSQNNLTEIKALVISENSLSLLRLLRTVTESKDEVLTASERLIIWICATKLWESISQEHQNSFAGQGQEVCARLATLEKEWDNPKLEDGQQLKQWILKEWNWPYEVSNE